MPRPTPSWMSAYPCPTARCTTTPWGTSWRATQRRGGCRRPRGRALGRTCSSARTRQRAPSPSRASRSCPWRTRRRRSRSSLRASPTARWRRTSSTRPPPGATRCSPCTCPCAPAWSPPRGSPRRASTSSTSRAASASRRRTPRASACTSPWLLIGPLHIWSSWSWPWRTRGGRTCPTGSASSRTCSRTPWAATPAPPSWPASAGTARTWKRQ
mmetsp:Transcript_5898/g.20075  ORF Transcript_5898/g.20075 Transcript_5898/m.20075 type:complete len:213 (+) Transcript_5898:329-967(+)